jgi:rhodanese-related sulfurtransferase
MIRTTMAVLISTLALAGCGGEEAAAAPIPELSVAQVATMLEAGDAVAVDANGAETRQERGIVPGARLLTSSASYDPAAELPSDHSTTLVFYCGGTRCTASDTAAERAREAGYANVNVMRAGIAGWIEEGHDVERPQS